MFLALNEIMHSKLRYALVAGVMFLIAYLVFFLTGLAYGLAQDNRTAVDKWEADSIVLSKDANSNLGMSMITKKTAEEVEGGKVAYLAQTPGVVTSKDSTDEGKINVSFFGIDKDQFIMPNIVEGKAFNNDDEAIGDSSLKEEYGLAVGDTVKLSGSDKTFKLTGFTDHAKFNVSPVLYTTINAYQQIRFEKEDTSENARINAIVVRGKINDLPEDLEQIKISKFINELPGYNAQVLTFGFMIGFFDCYCGYRDRDFYLCTDDAKNQYLWCNESPRNHGRIYCTLCSGTNIHFILCWYSSWSSGNSGNISCST